MASKDLVFRWLSLDAGAGREFDRMAGKASHAHGVFNALAVGVAATGVTVGVAAVKMADNFETAHNRLVSALLNTGQTVKGTEAPIAAANKRLESLGFNSAQTADSMAKLELATKNPVKSIKDLSLAADLARGRNIDLASASAILVKVETGHVALLGRLGIATKDATGHTISQKEALKRLTQLYGGDASRYTETFAGKQAVLRAELTDMGTKLGLVLIPALLKVADVIEKDVVPKLEKFSGWVSRNKTPIEDIAKVLAAIAAFRFASSKLNDISRLLGFGSKGLGGAGGGILGSAKPIPVYVTNAGFGAAGGAGVGGAGVGAGEAAAGGAAAGRLGRFKGALSAGPGAVGTVVGAGGIFNMESHSGPGIKNHVLAFLTGAMGMGAQHGELGGTNKVLPFDPSIPAMNATTGKMTSRGVAGMTFLPTAQSAKDAATNLATLNRYLVTNVGLDKKAADATINEFRRIPGAMRQFTAQAHAAGLTIGQALDAGVTIGIQQGKSTIDLVSIQVIDGVKHVMNNRASISSPSKMTAYIGRMLSAGLELGLRSGKKGVGQAASELIDSVRGNVMGAGSLGNVASMQDSLGGSGGTSIGQILAFTGGQVAQDRAFARNLAIARKHGLSKSVAQQIAMLGPDQGAPLAASIAGASRGQIHQLNADEAAIGRLGSQIGGTVNLSDTTIAKLGRAIRPHVSVTTPALLDRHNGKTILAHG